MRGMLYTLYFTLQGDFVRGMQAYIAATGAPTAYERASMELNFVIAGKRIAYTHVEELDFALMSSASSWHDDCSSVYTHNS